MLNVLGVGEDLAADGFQLVGAWLEYFCDDVWPLPGRGELVVVLVALHEAEAGRACGGPCCSTRGKELGPRC